MSVILTHWCPVVFNGDPGHLEGGVDLLSTDGHATCRLKYSSLSNLLDLRNGPKKGKRLMSLAQ